MAIYWLVEQRSRPTAEPVTVGNRILLNAHRQPEKLVPALLKATPPDPFFRRSNVTCNEYGTIYVISSDFGDRMTMQTMGLMVLLSEHF